jgi:hypothetical protein
MTNSNDNKTPDFNGVNQREGMQEEFRKEHHTNAEEFSKIDDMSLDDSIRNHAEVSGSTFGMESSKPNSAILAGRTRPPKARMMQT